MNNNVEQQEINLTMSAYSHEELARKYCLLQKDVMRAEKENKELKAELAKATLKQTPMKPLCNDKHYYDCPKCHEDIGLTDDDIYIYDMTPPKYCDNCGQALDWGSEDDHGEM